MKLHPEDPRLTAYVLGELPPDEAAAVERTVAADPALQAEIREIEGIRGFLTQRLATGSEKLLPKQRENIRRSAHTTSRPSGILPFTAFREKVQPWLIPAAAAAVLTIATFILLRMPGEQPKLTANNPTGEPAAPSGKPPVPPAATNLPEMSQRGSVSPADSQTLELPILAEKSNLAAVSQAILVDHRLPAKESVRLEEILNNFPLRLTGVASISRSPTPNWHPDNRDTGMTQHVATLSTELIACPWKPSARLLLISIRANPTHESAVKISFHANPKTVFSYRLLGFNPVAGRDNGLIPDKLPAGAVVNLAVEIKPSQAGGELGSLEWSTDGTAAPPVTVVLDKAAEPSDDARFAALVCTFSQWLSGDDGGLIDAEVVAALAREVASSSLPPERAEFLNLIDRSLHL